MTWTVQHTTTSKRGVVTRDLFTAANREAAERWLAGQVKGDARGYAVVRAGEGA